MLAFGAHPDDVELSVGGTLAKLANLGHRTGVADMTRGELGTRGTSRIRSREAQAAAEVLELKTRANLGLRDAHLQDTSAARLKVIEQLREFCPGLVFTHHWDDPHPDHVATQPDRDGCLLPFRPEEDYNGSAEVSTRPHCLFPASEFPDSFFPGGYQRIL